MFWLNNPWIRNTVRIMVKEKAIRGSTRPITFPLMRKHRLMAIISPYIHSAPPARGTATAVSM